MQHKFRSLLCLALCAIFTLSLTLPTLAAENEQDCGAKLMAITFDDGPGDYTLDLLAALEERGVKATFSSPAAAFPPTPASLTPSSRAVTSLPITRTTTKISIR